MKRVALAFLFGIFSAMPIVFSSLGLFQWVVMIPFALLMLSQIDDDKKGFFSFYKLGFFFFLGYFLPGYSWFLDMYPLSVTGISRAAALGVVLLAFLGISAFQAIGCAAVFPVFASASRGGMPKPILPLFMGALWCVIEWAQSLFWFGLPYIRLALGQVENLAFLQSAKLFGSGFTAFLIIAVNFYAALAIKEAKRRSKIAFALTAVLLFSVIGTYGGYQLGNKAALNKTVKIAALQGNISTEEKWSYSMREQTFSVYEELCRKASEAGAGFALFPETVFPYIIEQDPQIDHTVKNWADKYKITLMIGCFGSSGEETENIIRVYQPLCEGKNVYSKQRPVPFGEYVPMRDIIMNLLPILGEINMLDRSLLPGESSSVWQSEEGSFGHLICFDSIYDTLARESVKNGAEILLVSTNDSWFGDSVGSRLHASHAVLRAVENGRSVVRAANTGISSIVLPTGKTAEHLPADTEGFIISSVEFRKDITPYTRLGNIFVYISLAFSAFCSIMYKKGFFTKGENL